MKSKTLHALALILVTAMLSFPFLAQAKSSSPDASVMTTSIVATASDAATASDTTVNQIDTYQLPYPGILPDHPLYFLKRFRDFILDALIVDPVRKGEFYILQADKRLNMGVALIAKGNTVLGEQVVSRGEKYMDQGIAGLVAVKASGKDVPGYVIDKLTHAMAKHVMVLNDLIAVVPEAQKGGLRESLNLVTKLQGEVDKIK